MVKLRSVPLDSNSKSSLTLAPAICGSHPSIVVFSTLHVVSLIIFMYSKDNIITLPNNNLSLKKSDGVKEP